MTVTITTTATHHNDTHTQKNTQQQQKLLLRFLGRTSKTQIKMVCHVRHTQIISQAAATFVLLVCGIKEPTKYIFV